MKAAWLTDIYLDAAGAAEVLTTALAAAKSGATVGVVGVHKEPVAVDFAGVVSEGEGGRGQLYLELRRHGRPVDPRPWLAAAGGTG